MDIIAGTTTIKRKSNENFLSLNGGGHILATYHSSD